MRRLVFLGAGTAVAEIMGIVNAINKVRPSYNVIGVLDDNPELEGESVFGLKVLGTLDKVRELDPDIQFIFAIGSYRSRMLRHKIWKQLELPESRFETLIHPNSEIYPSAKIASGCIIHTGCIICNDAIVDSFCVLTMNCIIAPFAHLQSYVMVASRASVLSNTIVGNSAFIGASCTIGENLRLGPACVTVMGSIVLKNVGPGEAVMGNPARRTLLEGKAIEVPSELIKQWEKGLKEDE